MIILETLQKGADAFNEVFSEELDEIDKKDKKEEGSSYNKSELDKAIDKLKLVHRNL